MLHFKLLEIILRWQLQGVDYLYDSSNYQYASMIFISTDKSRLDIHFIYNFLKSSYWAKNIPFDMVKSIIDNSMCFGLFVDNRQVGFARVVTDYTTFAYLADVFIDPAERKKGYGKRLVLQILNDNRLIKLKRWHLVTKDAHLFYKKLGFSRVENGEGHMKIYKKPKYKN
ncbi:MAG: GNAT family N-acetyltransferase [Desulfobulbia bacterium]